MAWSPKEDDQAKAVFKIADEINSSFMHIFPSPRAWVCK